MNYEKYNISTSSEKDIYKFISTGVNGEIEKIIEFSKTDNDIVFNLAFGDKTIEIVDGEAIELINDKSESHNGDMEKVLATVAMSVYEYTSTFPNRQIFFSGSDEKRNRLYRMALTKNYDELNIDFIIFGVVLKDNALVLVEFCSNTKFIGYIVKRREPSKLIL